MAEPTETAPDALFDAVLTPHRSLGPAGFWIVMGIVAAVSFSAGLAFLLAGAWPVLGFMGADVLIVWLAFRASYRNARIYETVRLSEGELVVTRHLPGGRVMSWTFEPAWLRVAMDDPPRHDSRLTLSSHGRTLMLGAFLTPAERLDLARALSAALAARRAALPA